MLRTLYDNDNGDWKDLISDAKERHVYFDWNNDLKDKVGGSHSHQKQEEVEGKEEQEGTKEEETET